MKIQVLSDAHRNHYFESGWEPKISPSADIIICAGDMVGSPEGANRYFTSMRAKTKAKILYVLGNHEYWEHKINTTYQQYQKELKDIPNLFLMENDKLQVEDIVFFGATLWTDFDRETKVENAINGMADFIMMKDDPLALSYLMLDRHKRSLAWFRKTFLAAQKENKKLILISHHAPSYKCVNRRFRNSSINSAFVSNLEDKIKEWKPKLWIHGHVHDSVDIKIHDTRVLCNPCGYPSEANNGYIEELIVEI